MSIEPFDRDQIAAFARALSDFDQGVIEFRVMGASWSRDGSRIIPGDRFSRTLGGWYDNVESLVFDVMKLQMISGYVTVNPVDPVFLARARNKIIKIEKGQGASDPNIRALRWAFLDVDPKKPMPDISATEYERQAALARRDAILGDFLEIRESSIWGCSGNGGWILVRLPDFPNDAAHNALVGRFIDHFHSKYSDAEAEVDSKTRNPARIMGIPGTVKCKGNPIADRVWRMATFDSLLGGHTTSPPPFNLSSWLDRVAPQAPAGEPVVPTTNGRVTVAFPSTNGHGANLHERIYRGAAYLERFAPAVAGQRGHDQTFDAACALVKGFDVPPGHARPLLLKWNTTCVPPWADHEIDHKLEEADKKADDKPRGYLLGATDNIPRFAIEYEAAPAPEMLPIREWTDVGNGKRLVDMHGHQIRYCKAYGDWIVYDGRRWDQDHRYAIEAMAKDISARVIQEKAATERTDEEKKAWDKYAKTVQSREKMNAAIASAKSEPGLAVTPDDLDQHSSWLLNCRNGTLDLLTREFRPHDPGDMITKVAPVHYDPAATCPNWERFVHEIMGDDEANVSYLQRASGYALTGVIREHVLFFLFGSGRNGKSTFLNAIQFCLGDYATEVDSDLLISQAFPAHPTGLTELQGRRFVVANETDDGKRFAEALVKKLTGGNVISARRMHKDYYTFRPSHHIFLAANYMPEIRGTDPGMWRRIKPIPFTQSYDTEIPGGRKPDLELPRKLDEERSGILNWLIDGCREWQRRGLEEPPAVRALINQYRQEQDVLGMWLDESCLSAPGFREPVHDLYANYAAWAIKAGCHALGLRRFAAQLGERGYGAQKSNSITYRTGLKLKTDVDKSIERNSDSESPSYADSPIVPM